MSVQSCWLSGDIQPLPARLPVDVAQMVLLMVSDTLRRTESFTTANQTCRPLAQVAVKPFADAPKQTQAGARMFCCTRNISGFFVTFWFRDFMPRCDILAAPCCVMQMLMLSMAKGALKTVRPWQHLIKLQKP